MNQYRCKNCDSQQLSYQHYVKAIIPVHIDEKGNIRYQHPIVDYDDDLPVEQGFICGSCGCQLYHAGEWIKTESELRWYLTAGPSVLAEQEQEFAEYLEEQVRNQEEREKKRYADV